MELKELDWDFVVCKIEDISLVDFNREFVFLSKTDDEISLVCDLNATPGNAFEVEKDWKLLKISGILEFSMVGVIAKLSGILAYAGISLFVISTYNTDYILIKKIEFKKAVKELLTNGYVIK